MALLTIRRYISSDRTAVWMLHNAALKATGAYVGNGWWDEDLNHIEEEYLHNNGEFLVGFVDEQLVAMGGLQRKTRVSAEIRRMRVHPDFQRCGYGRCILNALEQRARELGYHMLRLDTTGKQTAAQIFYLKCGYQKIGCEQVRLGRQQTSTEKIHYEKHL